MRDYIVGGVPLRDPQGQWYIDYSRSSIGSEISRAIVGDQPYGYHGDPVPREGFFSTSRDSAVLNLVGTNKDDYNALFRGFQGLLDRPENLVLSAPQRSPLTGGSARFGQSFSNNPDELRQAICRKVGTIGVERLDEAAARLTIILENRLASWQSSFYYTTPPLMLASGSATLDLKTVAADSQAPIVDGLLRIKGPLALTGSITIRDRTTNRNVKWSVGTTAVTATQYVVIDLQTMRARLQATDTWSMTTGTDVSSRLDVSGEGQMSFTPGDIAAFPSSNDYNAPIIAVGQTNGQTAIEARLRRSYLS